MKWLLFSLLTIPFFTASCDKKTTNADSTTWNFDSIVFDKRIHVDNDTLKEGMKVFISFHYPKMAPEKVNIEAIQHIFGRILNGDDNFRGTPQKAFEIFKNERIKDAADLAKVWNEDAKSNDFVIPLSSYEHSTWINIDSIYPNMLTLSSSYYDYTGGAHGYGAITYYNIDLNKAILLNDTILFGKQNLPKIAKLIQNEVEIRNKDKESDEAIYLLVGIDEIKPNNNFFFTKDGITYLYNQYEIAPYAQGPVEITISYDKIKPLVNEPYRQTMDEIEKKWSHK